VNGGVILIALFLCASTFSLTAASSERTAMIASLLEESKSVAESYALLLVIAKFALSK
jgi:hypothetical protein